MSHRLENVCNPRVAQLESSPQIECMPLMKETYDCEFKPHGNLGTRREEYPIIVTIFGLFPLECLNKTVSLVNNTECSDPGLEYYRKSEGERPIDMQVLATQFLEAHHELWMQLAPVERMAGWQLQKRIRLV